jgi:hypothetical protein
MNNEPVAWMSNGEEFYVQKNYCPDFIPLYTHPVSQYKAITNTKIEPTVVSYTHPVKELTDEEIWELHQEHIDEVTCGHSMRTVGFIEFARAILRKAQE